MEKNWWEQINLQLTKLKSILMEDFKPALGTTKWGSLRGVSKFSFIFHCNKQEFLHILMQKLLLYDIPIKSYNMLNIDMLGSVQNNFAEIWTLKDCNVWATQ